MKAMILAAGRGERLRPLTDTCPKPLIAVNGKPLIVYHLEKLKQAGFNTVWINTAWLDHCFESILGDGSPFGLTIHYSHENRLYGQRLDTAGGIAQIANELGPDPFLVISADIVTDFDFATIPSLANKMMAQRKKAHLIVVDTPPHHSGDFMLDDHHLLHLASKENASEKKYTFSSIAIYTPEIFSALPKGQPYRLIDALTPYLQRQEITGQYYAGTRIDVGCVERLKEASHFLSQKATPL